MKKIEEFAIDAYQDHSSKYTLLKGRWAELLRRYENELRGDSIAAETQAKVRLGQAFALVENFVSRVIATIPRFHYLPRERDDVDFVEQYKEFNEYQHDQAQSKDAFETIAKWGSVCGLAGYKMGWKVEQILHKKKGKEVLGKVITNPTVVEMMDRMKLGQTIKVDENETISSWTLDAIAPFDLIWSTFATEKEDCYVLGHRIHNKTFKQLKNEGYDTRKFSQSLKSDPDYWKDLLDNYKGANHNKVLDDVMVEIAELYVKHQKDDGMWEYWVVTLADVADEQYSGNPVAVRTEKNPFEKQFCPVGIFRPIKRPGKFYGFGIIEPVLGVIDAEEDTLNMVVEAFWTDVARPMEYVPQNIIDEDALEYKPRTLVPVRKLGESMAVMPTPTPNMGSASFLLGFFEKTKQNISAITDYQTGANQKDQSQTATEVRTKTFLSEQRTNKILQRFESEVLEQCGKMALWLNKQYLADQKEIIYRVLGKKGRLMEKKMKLKVVEAIKDVVVVSGSSAYIDRNEERLKWRQLLLDAGQEMMMGPGGVPIDREPIWEHYLEEGFGIKDAENYIPSLKEREEATVQQKQADLKQAKQENLDPANARVMPDDDPKVHIPIHQAAARNKGMTSDDGKFIEYSPEQMQMLVEHINEHTRLAGGAVPNVSQAMEGAVGQKITNQVNPQQNGGNAQVARPNQ